MMYQQQQQTQQKRSAATTKQLQQTGSTGKVSSRPQSKGLLNRTTQEVSQGNQRSMNAPMAMRHTSPNQTVSQSFTQGGTQRQQLGARQATNNRSLAHAAQQAQSNMSSQQANKAAARQYQPSVMFKPGNAQQQFENMKQVLSEPEIITYQPQNPAKQLQPAPLAYQTQQQHQLSPPQQPQQQQSNHPMVARQQYHQQHQQYAQQQQPNYQAEFASNQNYQTQQPQPQHLQQQRSREGHMQRHQFEGPAGADNSNPYPRQFHPNHPKQGGQLPQNVHPTVAQQHQQQRRQQYASPGGGQQKRAEAIRRSPQPPHHSQAKPAAASSANSQAKPFIGSTHQAKAYETAPATNLRQVFHPQQIVGDEAQPDYLQQQARKYDLPRSEAVSDDDEQIRQMENLLAEIGQDVSELKKRPFYKQSLKTQNSEPRSSAKQQNRIMQNSKSSSLSPKNENRSRSYQSTSQEGTKAIPAVTNPAHRSLSPQHISASVNSGGPRKQASSQSRKHIVSQQPRNTDETRQWMSPNEHQRVNSQAPQILNPTPSHTNTMSLTVSVNPADQNQERLFRLSPLSSKMQEDTDGEEQSSQRFFNLNQSINTSQLDSSSPDVYSRQRTQLAASQSTTIMQQIPANRTFEDDNGNSDDNNPLRQLQSENQPVLRTSALNSAAQVRTETPLATSSEVRNDYVSSSRAFSQSSNRQSRNNGLVEGPNRQTYIQVSKAEAQCQTEKILDEGSVQKAKKFIDTVEVETQTARKDFQPIQLSPFDTYDLYFVKDLVNQLQMDNEVLVDSNQDLKHAFAFLTQKHKQLQQELVREKGKNSLLEETKKQLAWLTEERDKAIQNGMKLSDKVLTMNNIVRMAVDEQSALEEEAQNLTHELEEENKMLRSLLKIAHEHASPTTQAQLSSTIQEIEKRQADMAYKEDIRVRESVKQELEQDFAIMKRELPEKIEKELQARFEAQTKELEAMFEDKISKKDEETAILKKTLLEQSLQRLNMIQEQSKDFNSDGSNSLEGSSHGLHQYSGNSAERPPSSSDQLSSSQNTSQQADMQQELDDFAKIFHDDLTQEEKDLVNQLTAKAASQDDDRKMQDDDGHAATTSQSKEEFTSSAAVDADQQERMAMEELYPQDANVAEMLNQGRNEVEEDDDDDDYVYDMEQFGEVDKDSPKVAEKHMIKVVTNRKMTAAQDSEPSNWDYNAGFSQDLFSGVAPSSSHDNLRISKSNAAQAERREDENGTEMLENELDDDSLGENDPQEQLMTSKLAAVEQTNQKNVDLMADLAGAEDDFLNEDHDEDDKVRETSLKQQYDDFFTSESDEIEEDIIDDNESSDSDSEALDGSSFEDMVKAQKGGFEETEFDGEHRDFSSGGGKSESPEMTEPNNAEESSSSERRNKYKRDKKQSSSQEEKKTTSEFEENCSSLMRKESPWPLENATNSNKDMQDQAESIEFDPPSEEVQTIAQDFDDFFSSAPASNTISGGPSETAAKENTIFGFGKLGDEYDIIQPKGQPKQANQQVAGNFYENWADNDDEDDIFGEATQTKSKGTGAGIDEEDRRFFEELSKGFSARDNDEPVRDIEPLERNEMMDDTRATRQMLAAQRENAQNEQEDMTEQQNLDMGFGLEREEAKEDEYDFFLDNGAEENQGNAQGYHVIDEGDLQDSEEDLEELDEEEKEQRHREMLKEFKEKIEKEDLINQRSPRHQASSRSPRFKH